MTMPMSYSGYVDRNGMVHLSADYDGPDPTYKGSIIRSELQVRREVEQSREDYRRRHTIQ